MWQKTNSKLYRKFQFKDFSAAFAFMTRVAFEAEKMNHHPKWSNVYNQLKVELETHDVNGISDWVSSRFFTLTPFGTENKERKREEDKERRR